jgi:hypothetical protein
MEVIECDQEILDAMARAEEEYVSRREHQLDEDREAWIYTYDEQASSL